VSHFFELACGARRPHASSTKTRELTCGEHHPHASAASSHAEQSAGV